MTKKIFRIRFFSLVSSIMIILLSSGTVYALSYRDNPDSNPRKVSFAMNGGYSHSESIGSMVDLNIEIQFSLSSNVRVGLSIGYLSGSDSMHMDGNFGSMQGGMMSDMMGGMNGDYMGGFSEHNHSLRVIPLTLSLYYVLPVNPKLNMFMFGGGGYYIGSYNDQASQNDNVFGPHIGVGIDFKIADRIIVVAEGLYRFANLKGFTSELHEGFREGMEGEEHEEGFWHFHHHDEEWHFHEEHENEQQMLMDVPPSNISLNGISLRVGIKFLF